MANTIVTLGDFIKNKQKTVHGALGDFTHLIAKIGEAAVDIQWEVSKGHLSSVVSKTTDRINIQKELVHALDDFSNNRCRIVVGDLDTVCAICSEEDAKATLYGNGKYVLRFDPLDGSSNIIPNVSIGTIFSLCKKSSVGEEGMESDCLQKGSEQIAAGYIIYGPSTVFVYTAGEGVHFFTLHPGRKKFALTNENVRIPEMGKIISCNYMYLDRMEEAARTYLVKAIESKKYSGRYIGSLVADVHRELISGKGGIFLYPGIWNEDKDAYLGKLRLLYEASPLAFIVEQAGGLASTGAMRVRDIDPEGLHDRVPLVIGSKDMVIEYEETWQKMDRIKKKSKKA